MTKVSSGSVHPSMFSLTPCLCFSSPFYPDSFPHVLTARTIMRIIRATLGILYRRLAAGRRPATLTLQVYIFFHTLMTLLPPFLHPLLDFVPGFGGIINPLQRQIKAEGSSNPQSTLVFPLPPVLSRLGNKFPPSLRLHFIFHILPKKKMSSGLLTSPDIRRNQGTGNNLSRVTQPVRSKSEI